MSGTRDQILGAIRRSLKRSRLDATTEGELRARVAAHRRNVIPLRAVTRDRSRMIELFVAMAEEVQATVTRVTSLSAVASDVARYLAAENLPSELVMAPDPSLDAIPWEEWPLLQIRRGRAAAEDKVGLTSCFAAIAETGTLMLISDPQTPTTINFLPDTHIVIVRGDQLVGCYEDGWDRLRASRHGETLPRTINFITGPSRTADIEQHIELGAHGPRRLHIILIEDDETTRSVQTVAQPGTPA